jgi:hypothetical protein
MTPATLTVGAVDAEIGDVDLADMSKEDLALNRGDLLIADVGD